MSQSYDLALHAGLPTHAPSVHPGHGGNRRERPELERMARGRGGPRGGSRFPLLLHLDAPEQEERTRGASSLSAGLKRASTRKARETDARARAARPVRPAAAGPSGRSMALLFAIALLLRLIHVLAMRLSPYFDNPVIDAATYDDAARSIAAGHGHPDLIFWQPPGYSYFLSWIYSVAGPGYLAPRIAQALLGATSALMTAWIGARVFGRRVGLVAGYGVALYGMLIYYDGELLTPSLTVALQLAAVALALRARERPERGAWLWGASGLLAGLGSVVTA